MSRRAAGEGGTEETKGERTRRKLVDATATLLRRQGYHATGLADIVAESGAPRGSLYFHFPGGKDELACAALVASAARWRARIDEVTRAAPDLGAAIEAAVGVLAADLEASGWDLGCPVAAVALEATSPVVREVVVAHFAAWLDDVGARLVAAGIPAGAARELAIAVVAAVEGALMLARVAQSREPLVAVSRALRAAVTALTGPSAADLGAP